MGSDRAPESSLIESRINIGKVLVALKKYKQAEKLLLAQEKDAVNAGNGYQELKLRATKELLRIYRETKQYKQAFFYAEEYYTMKDSLFNIEKREEIIRINSMNEYQAKTIQDSLAYAEQIRLDDIQKEKEKVNIGG